MNISRFFILRPVATTLLMLALLLSGLLVWRMLPVSALPQVDYPIIQVYTFQPGANPDTVQRTITAPLEREMGKIAEPLKQQVLTVQLEHLLLHCSLILVPSCKWCRARSSIFIKYCE